MIKFELYVLILLQLYNLNSIDVSIYYLLNYVFKIQFNSNNKFNKKMMKGFSLSLGPKKQQNYEEEEASVAGQNIKVFLIIFNFS